MPSVRLYFSKSDSARFLSHLDLMTTIEYGMRRAGLPVLLSSGFNPRPRFSLAAALPLGYLGEREILEIDLREPLPADEVARRLQCALPPGITIFEAQVVPEHTKGAASRLRGAIYRIELPQEMEDLPPRIDSLLARDRIEIEEQREDGVRTRDVRPMILSLEAETPSLLRLRARLDGAGTVRPEQILDLLSVPRDGARVIRERLELA